MESKSRPIYKFIKSLAKLKIKRPSLIGEENLPDEPLIFVCNHALSYGPIISELYFPREIKAWCIADMMKIKSAPSYAYRDFWSNKPQKTRWLYKLVAYPLSPIAVYLINSSEAIPVYKDTRLLATIRQTLKALNEGKSIVIFPERNKPYDNIVNDFQTKFVDIARFYYLKTRKELCFVPTYIAPTVNTVVFGEPIRYDSNEPMTTQRDRICSTLKEEISTLAKTLPVHTVIPYLNMDKTQYPLSK